MAQNTILTLKIPIDITLHGWEDRLLNSLSHNVGIIFNREDKKLRREMEVHAKAIYNKIIYEYYKYRIPNVYDRHGDKRGFNFYNSFDGGFTDDMYQFKPDSSRLMRYYSFVRTILRGKGRRKLRDKKGNVLRYKKGYPRTLVMGRMLQGIISIPKWIGPNIGFQLNVSYQPIHMPITTGTPEEIYHEAENRLSEFYNNEMVNRIRKGIRSLTREYRW